MLDSKLSYNKMKATVTRKYSLIAMAALLGLFIFIGLSFKKNESSFKKNETSFKKYETSLNRNMGSIFPKDKYAKVISSKKDIPEPFIPQITKEILIEHANNLIYR